MDEQLKKILGVEEPKREERHASFTQIFKEDFGPKEEQAIALARSFAKAIHRDANELLALSFVALPPVDAMQAALHGIPAGLGGWLGVHIKHCKISKEDFDKVLDVLIAQIRENAEKHYVEHSCALDDV